jgi:hypothetical protein
VPRKEKNQSLGLNSTTISHPVAAIITYEFTKNRKRRKEKLDLAKGLDESLATEWYGTKNRKKIECLRQI